MTRSIALGVRVARGPGRVRARGRLRARRARPVGCRDAGGAGGPVRRRGAAGRGPGGRRRPAAGGSWRAEARVICRLARWAWPALRTRASVRSRAATAPRLRATCAAIRSVGERLGVARPSTRGARGDRCGASARPASPHVERAAIGPLDPVEGGRGDPTGVASTGTSQASASSAASPKLSRSDGTSTALAALTHSGTWSGSTRPSVEQPARRRRAASARSWRFSGRPGSAGNSRYGPSRVEPERRARLRRAGSAGSGRGRRRRAGPRVRPAPPSAGPARERLGHGRDEVEQRQRRERDRPRAGMARGRCRAGSPRAAARAPRARARRSARSGRGRCRSASPREAAAQLRAPRARRRRRPGREREHARASTAPIRRSASTWSRDEAPERRALGRRVHVRDDQRAHRGAASASAAPSAARRRARGRLWHHAARCAPSPSSRSPCSTRASAA